MKLWIIEVEGSSWDEIESAVVWANTPEEAEKVMREAVESEAYFNTHHQQMMPERLWIKPEWKIKVSEAPTSGLVHTHVVYG